MLLTNHLKEIAGVNNVQVMMGTPANKDIFKTGGLATPENKDIFKTGGLATPELDEADLALRGKAGTQISVYN
ncbi:hypothetical protein EFR39_05075 [Limosilactobacillus fermentum]|uniref:hypothetical protein n=1 Tax=Limosilactobacillus fermentum TaxID=1613 RepID=UPI0021A5185B|nr:hypothetical protein [Limosilactobacillus fermentum]MCT3447124.1 hypothetical protein [Limosilactobacillus fermentum]MCT3455342.1 hypothetical protein [Limosilactobacillus fermentum]MCT3461053.1 hypothetical protein [Limosilactobacillus fermentum]